MIQWARLNEENIVIDVTISEGYDLGGDWLSANFGGIWLELPQDDRGLGTGSTWDEGRNAFIPFKSYPSWVLNEETLVWEAPVPKPDGDYGWNEGTQSWDPVSEA